MKQKKIRIHESPATLFLQVLTLMIISDIFFFLVVILFDFTPMESLFVNVLTGQEEFFFAILVLQVLLTTHLFLQRICSYYWFENNLLLHHKGLIWTHTEECILSEVESATYSKSLLGRMFNFGTVRMVFSNRKYCLRRIPHPEEFIRIINKEKNCGTSS